MKPFNVMVSKTGVVTLIDFGFADRYIEDREHIGKGAKTQSF